MDLKALTRVGHSSSILSFEFYGQSCNRLDLNVSLTPGDIDVLDLRLTPVVMGSSVPGGNLGPVTPSQTQSGLGGRGWVDIDVRFGPPGGSTFAAPGVQANVLMGTVLITDSASDTAIEYPMAPGIGISDHGLLGRIVRRNAAGQATEWSGRYEPFPPRVFVPAFFAEGTDLIRPKKGTTYTAFLALAAPADGNWDGSGNGEAPGQQLGAPGPAGEPLINFSALIWDGCERNASFNLQSHYVNNSLSLLFGSVVDRTFWTTKNCGVIFPGRDELSGQAVGWLDLFNIALACDSTTRGAGATNCPAYTFADTATHGPGTNPPSPGVGTGQRRGLVGVLIQTVATEAHIKSKHPPRSTTATATRLWGDRTPWQGRQGGGPFFDFALCASSIQTAKECTYSFADLVSDQDIDLHGILTGAVPSSPPEFP